MSIYSDMTSCCVLQWRDSARRAPALTRSRSTWVTATSLVRVWLMVPLGSSTPANSSLLKSTWAPQSTTVSAHSCLYLLRSLRRIYRVQNLTFEYKLNIKFDTQCSQPQSPSTSCRLSSMFLLLCLNLHISCIYHSFRQHKNKLFILYFD